MVRRKPLVIVTRKLPEAIETRMMELFDTRLNERNAPLSKAEKQRVAKRVKDAEKSTARPASAPAPATRALSAEEVEQRLDDLVTY